LPDGYKYTIDGWENAPIARKHHADTGCQNVYTVECQSQTIVTTTYCPFKETTVEFRCLANGFDHNCLFPFRTVIPPMDGSMLVRTPGHQEGWTEVQPGLIEVRVVRPSRWSEAEVHAGSAPFTGSIGPDGFPSNIATITLPQFTTVFAKNRCDYLTESLRPGCEFPWIQTLRALAYSTASLDVQTRDSDLVIGYPMDLKAFEEGGGESAGAYIGDSIPGYSARSASVSLNAQVSTIDMSIILVMNSTVRV